MLCLNFSMNLSLIVWGGDLAKWHFMVVSLIQVIFFAHLHIVKGNYYSQFTGIILITCTLVSL